MKELPIGLFDSGVGGLTVFREIERILPEENLVYFGDTARLPYGNKSPETILRYTLKSAQFLVDLGIKALIVACHTASACALDVLQEKLSIPVIGVIQPGIDLLMKSTKTNRVAILATKSTIESGVYQKLVPSYAKLISVACPLFVPLVEEHFFDHEAAFSIANHYLQPLREADIDAVLLACTHYPLLMGPIQKALGSSIKIVEPASCCAERLKKLLVDRQLLNVRRSSSPQFFTTDRLAHLARIANNFLGKELSQISCVNID